MLRVVNYKEDNRIYDYNGISFVHLATVYLNGKTYIAYKVLIDGSTYVEELLQSKVSDAIFGEDQLKYIEDDKIWTKIVMALQKENII